MFTDTNTFAPHDLTPVSCSRVESNRLQTYLFKVSDMQWVERERNLVYFWTSGRHVTVIKDQ